jgi:hypothetical protein
LIVACVLRSGGDFDARDVIALRTGVAKHLPARHQFVCLTDAPIPGVLCFRLRDDAPKWWAKMELFRTDLFAGRVLYLDLDTLPVGDMTRLASYDGAFAMIRDLGSPKRRQSGVMAFAGGGSGWIYDKWQADQGRIMQQYRGDGEWLHAITEADVLQDTEPGIYSLKWQCRHEPPADAVLVCGHGIPRLSDPLSGWAHKLWRSRL